MWVSLIFRYVLIAMEALDQLLMACHSQSIKPFVESFLHMVAKLLESGEPKLQVLGTNSVSKDAKSNLNTSLLICNGKVVSEATKYLSVTMNWEDSVCSPLGPEHRADTSWRQKICFLSVLKILLMAELISCRNNFWKEQQSCSVSSYFESLSCCIGKTVFSHSSATRAMVREVGNNTLSTAQTLHR